MLRIAVLAIFVFGRLATPVLAQNTSSAEKPSACPQTTTLDELIHALDEAVSGPADKDRACFRDLMLPEARLSPVSKAQDGSFAPHLLTVDGWIDAVKARGHAVFFERQVKVSSDTYGHVAHLWSTYELRETPDGKPEVRGINSIQAVYDGTRWRVLNILWQAETPDLPVPAKYLP
jgi:hypothetical protein